MGSSRYKGDKEDFSQLLEWFAKHEPFGDTVTGLRLSIYRICATEDDNINCHLLKEFT